MSIKSEMKGDLRRHYRDLMKAKTDAAEASRRMSEQLCAWLLTNSVASATRADAPLAAFQCLPGEPDLSHAYTRLCASAQTALAFPRVDGESLRFFLINASQDPGQSDAQESAWCQGPWGLREPDPARAPEVPLRLCRAVLVPGLAFDRHGYRLGRGKGYYDRALASYSGLKIGVAFTEQLTESLPAETHDVRMDFIVTESSVVEVTPVAHRTALGWRGKGNVND